MTHPLLQSQNIFSKYSVPEILDRLNQLVTEGYVSCRPHPEYPQLRIFNYTDKCTYDKYWNELTLSARGLIFDVDAKRLVGLPFPKIFNFGELGLTDLTVLPAVDSVVEKMDGSLGIVFFYDGVWNVATRGSFESEQAVWATAKLREAIAAGLVLEKNYTYLVEIIYKANTVVLHYDEEQLCLLAAFNLTTFQEVDRPDWETVFYKYSLFTIPFDYNWLNHQEITDGIKSLKDKEGVVVRFTDGTRIKFKTEEYCVLHRIKFGLTPLAVWEAIVQGTIDSYAVQVPEEFQGLFESYRTKLKDKFNQELLRSYCNFMTGVFSIPHGQEATRARFAESIKSMPHQGILWMMYDYFVTKKGNDRSLFEKKILNLIRPDGNIL